MASSSISVSICQLLPEVNHLKSTSQTQHFQHFQPPGALEQLFPAHLEVWRRFGPWRHPCPWRWSTWVATSRCLWTSAVLHTSFKARNKAAHLCRVQWIRYDYGRNIVMYVMQCNVMECYVMLCYVMIWYDYIYIYEHLLVQWIIYIGINHFQYTEYMDGTTFKTFQTRSELPPGKTQSDPQKMGVNPTAAMLDFWLFGCVWK